MSSVILQRVFHRAAAAAAAASTSTTARILGRQQAASRQLVLSSWMNYNATTASIRQIHKDAKQAEPTPEELAETPETIPEWQNPLHHNNEDQQKMFDDDFEDGIAPAQPLPPFETSEDKVVPPPHIESLAQEIVQLNLLELKELTDKIAQHFDFDDEVMAASYAGGATMAVAAGGGAGTGAAEEEVQKKTIFDVKLIGFDAKAKIKVIKEIRAIAGLGLKEAKELVESAPKVFQKDLKQERADEIKAQLEAVGAQIEIV